MRKRKKIDSSTIILSSIIVIFTIIIFLSIPVFFNYKSIQNEIEDKFFLDFKINLKILDDISFRVLPRPHLLIKRANLDFNKDDKKSVITDVENLKIFIPSNKIYSKKNLTLTDFHCEDINLKLKMSDLSDIRNHLYFKINKPISATNIKIFLYDDKNNIILISPIKKLNYQINDNFTAKELKLKGSIFDIEFSSNWKRNYNEPKSTSNEINLKNPDIFIRNLYSYKSNKEFKGSSSIDFLNENISFTYKYEKSKLKINSPEKKNNQKIKFNSMIDLDPFYFNGEIIFEEKKLSFITDYILNFIFRIDKEFYKNLNGELKITLTNLDNKLFNNGKILISLDNGKIENLNSFIEMEKIGILKSTYKYKVKEGELFFQTKNELVIANQKELAKRFQLNLKKIKSIEKIFFDFERNIDTDEMFLSNVYLNNINSQNLLEEIINTNNMLVLKSTLRDILP